jgi:DNA-binding NarL/FixJ family response regulator
MSDVPIRLILADDHSIVLHGLQQFLEGSGFTVAACCRSAEEALAAVRQTSADVLVLDLRMPGGDGLDVLRAVAREQPLLRVVLLTAVLRDQEAHEAMRLGARGIVLKESAPDDLVECLRRVHAGE